MFGSSSNYTWPPANLCKLGRMFTTANYAHAQQEQPCRHLYRKQPVTTTFEKAQPQMKCGDESAAHSIFTLASSTMLNPKCSPNRGNHPSATLKGSDLEITRCPAKCSATRKSGLSLQLEEAKRSDAETKAVEEIQSIMMGSKKMDEARFPIDLMNVGSALNRHSCDPTLSDETSPGCDRNFIFSPDFN